jgi:ABC-2 type transport system permease protein
MSAFGRTMRALPTLFRVGFAGAVAYRSELLVWILSTNMPLVMLALWSQVAREAPVGRYGEKEFVAYFLATFIVRLLTGSWVVWELSMEVRQGQLGMRLLKPIHPFVVYASDNLAALPLRAALAIPIGLIAFFALGAETIRATWMHALVVPLAIFGSWAITFSAMLAIGALSLFWESAVAVFDLWLGLYFVLSGYLMPLEFFPAWLRRATSWLPFRYCLAFPVDAMTGMQPIGACLEALAVQWTWVLALLTIALAIWKRGLARYAVYGG